MHLIVEFLLSIKIFFFNQPQSANAWMQSLPQPTTNFVATTPPPTSQNLMFAQPKVNNVWTQPVTTSATPAITPSVAVPPTTQAKTTTSTTTVPSQQNLIKPTVDDTNFSDISSLAQPTSSKDYIDSLKGAMLTPYGESLREQGASVAGLPQKEAEKNVAQNDWIKYNILNPYSGGMDLNTRLAYTGQQFGQGNTGMGLVGAGLTALGGVRSFLSGYASGKGQQTLEQQMYDRLYNNDNNLYTRAQEGGDIEVPKYKKESSAYSYYQEGGEYELSDEEIQDLLSKGYKLE